VKWFKRKLKVAPNGQLMRPPYGKCPECRVEEREWCKNTCGLLDMANMGRE
jgi:hypothetical protein